MKKLVLFWLASLALVSVATFAYAQQRFPSPQLVSGDDIGFRIEGTDINGRPVGVLLVRWNGEWREVGSMLRVRPVESYPPTH
jgi:hypothetical protein